jgi:hypothetical protein
MSFEFGIEFQYQKYKDSIGWSDCRLYLVAKAKTKNEVKHPKLHV